MIWCCSFSYSVPVNSSSGAFCTLYVVHLRMINTFHLAKLNWIHFDWIELKRTESNLAEVDWIGVCSDNHRLQQWTIHFRISRQVRLQLTWSPEGYCHYYCMETYLFEVTLLYVEICGVCKGYYLCNSIIINKKIIMKNIWWFKSR